MAQKTPAISPAFHSYFLLMAEMVERFFGKITAERIRRGAFKSVLELTKPS